jgi:peptidoglycan/LPS O-acetylase OafA/YrhL
MEAMTSDPKPDNRFVGALESLRGLAALMVAVGHSMMILKIGGLDMLWARPLSTINSFDALAAKAILFFASGGAAVTLFFVLSGVVLGLSLDHAKLHGARGYAAFFVRRILRIYPAYIVSIAFIVLFLFMGAVNSSGIPIASTFFNWSYRNQPSLAQIAGNLALLHTTLNPIGWTLTTEMLVATFFPLLYFISRRWAGYAVVVVLLVLLTPTLFPAQAGIIFFPHVYKFFIGLLLPRYGKIILRHICGGGNAGRSWFLLAALLLLAERRLVDMTQPGFGIIETLGAAMIVMGLLEGGGSKVLEYHLIRKLGQQSYSFYLWHFPLLFVIAMAMFSFAPSGLLTEHGLGASLLLCAVSVFAAFRVSAASYHFVEAPAIRAGKHLVGRLFRQG